MPDEFEIEKLPDGTYKVGTTGALNYEQALAKRARMLSERERSAKIEKQNKEMREFLRLSLAFLFATSAVIGILVYLIATYMK